MFAKSCAIQKMLWAIVALVTSHLYQDRAPHPLIGKYHPQHCQEAVLELVQLFDLGLYWLAGRPA